MSLASAPSNIALIKYMGKSSIDLNLPSNASISITTENLRTYIKLNEIEKETDEWSLLKGYNHMELSDSGKERYLSFFSFLKDKFSIKKNFLIESANNFPSDAGLASSASSFAAITQATWNYAVDSDRALALKAVGLDEKADSISIKKALAKISRQGSGSSCRSFFGPLCEWKGESVTPVETVPFEFLHFVIVLDKEKKKVSSSEAHKRVPSSLLYDGRDARAEQRLRDLMRAFESNDWNAACEVVWAEFWDMHVLFETSKPHFSFMSAKSLDVLRQIEKMWEDDGNGPMVTMDAGPNVHCFFKKEDLSLFDKYKAYFANEYTVIS